MGHRQTNILPSVYGIFASVNVFTHAHFYNQQVIIYKQLIIITILQCVGIMMIYDGDGEG